MFSSTGGLSDNSHNLRQFLKQHIANFNKRSGDEVEQANSNHHG